MTARSTKWILSAVALFVIICDQLTKHTALDLLSPGESVEVIPGFFNYTLVFNKGIAFGFLARFPEGIRHFLLIVTTLAALIAVVYFLLGEYYDDWIAQFALAMIMGGAVGNIIDRVRLGHVVDFLDFYYGGWHWPAFNLADSAICIGVGILLLRYPQHHKRKVDDL